MQINLRSIFKILSVSQVVLGSRRPVDIYWRLPGLSTQELHQEDLGALLTDKFRLEQVELDRVIVSTLTVEAGSILVLRLSINYS